MFFVDRDFSLPDPLNEALLAALWGGRLPTGKELDSTGAHLRRLWPALAKGRGQHAERHYSFDGELARAYAAYYLAANMMKLPLILEEMRLLGLRLPAGKLRWLDGGTGPGTALWGLGWWALHRGIADLEFVGLEQSLHFLKLAPELGRALLAAGGGPGGARVSWESFRHTGGEGNSGERLRQGARSLVQWIRALKPHVVSFMNSVGEMAPSQSERDRWLANVVEEMASAARADGEPRWMILVEPGTQAASRELLMSREALRSRSDVRVWLPCLGARPCGALAKAGDWCHEEAGCVFPRWHGDLGERAGLRKEALLFSYLVVSVGNHPEPSAPWPSAAARVVSQRMKEKGLTQCFLCTEGGKVRARVLDSRASVENVSFAEIRRGEIFDRLELSEKGDVLEMGRHGPTGGLDPTVFPRPR